MNNQLWSNLSNNLKSSDASSVGSFANMVIATMPELLSNEPTNLFTLNNSIAMSSSNINNIDNH